MMRQTLVLGGWQDPVVSWARGRALCELHASATQSADDYALGDLWRQVPVSTQNPTQEISTCKDLHLKFFF